MTLNPLRWYRERQDAKKQQAALAGKASSGHLSQGQRDRLFRERKS